MLHRANVLIDHRVVGADGDVGRVKDLLFDDVSWEVRYLVVDSGSWLNSREVLLTPASLSMSDPTTDVLTTGLTQQQVQDSPPVLADLPVSRDYEERLFSHYGWTPYWNLPLYAEPGPYTYPMPTDAGLTPFSEPRVDRDLNDGETPASANKGVDPHLRSFKEVKGYHLAATDGDIGHVDDALIDTESWRLTHFIVDTRNWLPGRHVVIDRSAVTALRWEDSKAVLSLTRAQVKAAPEYDPHRHIDEDYQRQLSRYYHSQMPPPPSY